MSWATTPTPRSAWTSFARMNIPASKATMTSIAPRDGPLDGFNPAAAEAVNWTRKQLSDGGQTVAARPEILAHGHQFHHRPRHPRRPATLGLCVRQAGRRRQLHLPEHRGLLLRPHPCARSPSSATAWCAAAPTPNSRSSRARSTFVNVGAIGQPRDNNPKAAYVVYDVDEGDHRVAPAGLRHRRARRKKSLMPACRRAWRSGWPGGNAPASEAALGREAPRFEDPHSQTEFPWGRGAGAAVLRAAQAPLPHSQIYWWIDPRLAPLLDGDPDLAGVVPFERRRWAAPANWPEIWRSHPLDAAAARSTGSSTSNA